MTNTGPLAGVKVIELGGIGPGPHAAMVLADLGADVVRVRRPGGLQIPAEDLDLLHRGKRVVDLDVKSEPGKLLELVAKADVLVDGFHPVADGVDDEVDRHAQGRARIVHARRRRTVLPHLRDLRRQVHGGRAIEPKFFAQLLARLGLSAQDVPNQLDASAFPGVHKLFTEKFAGKTRDEWSEIFADTDACVTPVLTSREAAQNEHLMTRSTLVTANGVDQAAPAPRFSRTPSGPVCPPPKVTTSIEEINW